MVRSAARLTFVLTGTCGLWRGRKAGTDTTRHSYIFDSIAATYGRCGAQLQRNFSNQFVRSVGLHLIPNDACANLNTARLAFWFNLDRATSGVLLFCVTSLRKDTTLSSASPASNSRLRIEILIRSRILKLPKTNHS